MISYETKSTAYGKIYRVLVDGKFVGTIKWNLKGWQYFPKNSQRGGTHFDSAFDCMRSLEADHD